MDALARLLGDEERESIGDGVYLRRAPASAYLSAYRARADAGEGNDANVLFIAYLMAGGLEDESGAPFFKSGGEALDRLPIDFIMKHAERVIALNGLDDEGEDGLEGKSEGAP